MSQNVNIGCRKLHAWPPNGLVEVISGGKYREVIPSHIFSLLSSVKVGSRPPTAVTVGPGTADRVQEDRLSLSQSWTSFRLLMVGLKICLLLCLGYQVSTNHQVGGVSAFGHEKQHNEVFKTVKNKHRFEKIGKFKQSSIGSQSDTTKRYSYNIKFCIFSLKSNLTTTTTTIMYAC